MTASPLTRAPLSAVVIAGGGTGGHVYPGVAIAEEVLRRNPAARIAFIGSQRGLENKIIPPLGYALEIITVSRLKGGGLWSKVKGLFRLPVGIFQSWRILRRVRPDVVIGVGGYASGPALLAAWMTWRKFAIQEQNATPGLTNRWLGKIAKRVFLGFAAAASHFNAKKTRFTGNPIRAAIATQLGATLGASSHEARPARRPISADAPLRVLVFGGSQGATFLNERVPALLARLAASGVALAITHQTGKNEVDATTARYAALGLAAQVVPFIDTMATAYAAADLAICRSGALTIAELTAVGLPSILVPFPFAADNHQEANARVLESAGAGIVATQSAYDEAALATRLITLARDPAALTAMSTAARSLARVDAAAHIVTHLEELVA